MEAERGRCDGTETLMRLLVTAEIRLDQTPDGHAWAPMGIDYGFWKGYLEVFEQVRVLARIRSVEQPSGQARRADGPNVTFVPVPYYVGPWQYAWRAAAVRRAVRLAFCPGEALILRVPSTFNTPLWRAACAAAYPYGVQVVGDPHDVFAPGVVRSFVRPFVRASMTRNLRRMCRSAAAAMYVTSRTLQERYPSAPGVFHVGCSSIELGNEAYVHETRSAAAPAPGQPVRMVLVGTLEQLYKGPDVAIRAVAINAARGYDLHLAIIGEGRHEPALRDLARELNVAQHVRFVGQLPAGAAVREELDRADLFVLPSRTEGLPRALIEAMARGLPCIASAVGGIPELLSPEDLVPPGDAVALATKIREVLTDRELLAKMAERNLRRARDYHADVLRPRRRAFYEAVRDKTREWQRRNARAAGAPPGGKSTKSAAAGWPADIDAARDPK